MNSLSLICPVSTERVYRDVVRMTGFMMASMIALYVVTGSIYFIAIIAMDYFIRAFTPLRYSPFSGVAQQVARRIHVRRAQLDKAPKIFAARVGFLFALSTLILHFIYPVASVPVGLTLMAFALLESVFDICMGCLVYTYIVLPIFRPQDVAQPEP